MPADHLALTRNPHHRKQTMTRTILITGTSSGFGRVTAERLVRDGYRAFASMRAIASILAEAGKIDVLVNNAGIASVGVTEAFTADEAKAIFDTNVIGLLRVTNAVLPSMRKRHDGLVINIGSILGRVTFPFF